MTNLIDAAVYYRMSDDRQEDSIERQQKEVRPFAARNGYRIVREYTDEGIPGDEVKKRKAFRQLLADAQRGEWSVILCDDKDRFGRFDSIDQGFYVKPLRDAGLSLVTVAQGKIDWHSFAGRITDAVLQEAKKVESQATSRRVITWMLQMAKAGKWLGGHPPYGYSLQDDTVLGKRLVPGKPEEVHAVQLMFHLYGDRGFTLEQIANELHARGIFPPSSANRRHKGGERIVWQRTTIRALLRNRKYVGDLTWNRSHEGKYSGVRNGTVHTSDAVLAKGQHAKGDWIVVPDVHEALVERDLFERVQARLGSYRTPTEPRPQSRNGYLLAGLLICSDCGWRMIGAGCGSGKRRYYQCGRYHLEGNLGCHSNMVREDKLFNVIVRKLQEAALCPENVERLKVEVARQLAETVTDSGGKARRLARELADLEQKLRQGTERMALIDADLLPEFAALLREWREQRERLREDLEKAKAPRQTLDVEEALQFVQDQLYRLRDALLEANPADARAVLVELISKVELTFEHRRTAKQTRSRLTRGVISFRPQEGFDLSCLLYKGANPTREA
jgi:site-specific DNA recombinase